MVQFNHKVVVVEIEVGSVESEKSGIDTAAKVETHVFLNQNLLVFRIENHILPLAHVHHRNALDGKIHILQIEHRICRSRHCLRLEPDKVVVDFLYNAVEIAVELGLYLADFGFRIIIDNSFVCQSDKQTLGNRQTHFDVARELIGIKHVGAVFSRVAAQKQVWMHIFESLVLVVTLGAEIVFRLKRGRTDTAAQNVGKVDFGVVHVPSEQAKVHLHIVI